VHSKMEHLRFRHANQLTATPKLFMIRLHIAQLVKMTLFCASERRPTHPLKEFASDTYPLDQDEPTLHVTFDASNFHFPKDTSPVNEEGQLWGLVLTALPEMWVLRRTWLQDSGSWPGLQE